MATKSITAMKSALGLAVMSTGLAVSASATAGENPFLAQDLGSGYQLASKDMEGKCGEAKCGENKAAKHHEGKCGEAKCGEKKAAKSHEGKCGEGKCGS